MKVIPLIAKAGFTRCPTLRAFLRHRLQKLFINYVILDCLANFMSMDPYFILGSQGLAFYQGGLPPHLQILPPLVRRALRCSCALLGVYSVLESYTACSDIALYFLTESCFPSKQGLWTYPSHFGSFEEVFRRGLPGMWGTFWHQTFRMSFMAPASYLLRKGYLKKGSRAAYLTTAFTAFFASGLFHASGSMTASPLTKPWQTLLFFSLQPFGMLLQSAMTSAAEKLFPAQGPRAVSIRRLFHLIFTVVFLLSTGSLFMHDMSNSGLWLWEPVPVSFLKLFGFNAAWDADWWRWSPQAFAPSTEGQPWLLRAMAI